MLQSFHVVLIQNFKVNYRKQFMHYVFARINNDLHAFEIANAGNEVTVITVKNCYAKCGITEYIAENNDKELDEEFGNQVKELTGQVGI